MSARDICFWDVKTRLGNKYTMKGDKDNFYLSKDVKNNAFAPESKGAFWIDVTNIHNSYIYGMATVILYFSEAHDDETWTYFPLRKITCVRKDVIEEVVEELEVYLRWLLNGNAINDKELASYYNELCAKRLQELNYMELIKNKTWYKSLFVRPESPFSFNSPDAEL